MKTINRILCSVFSFSILSVATLTVQAATPGAVIAWGAGETNTGVDPQFGQSIVPAGLSDVTAVSGGVYHSVALGSDGSVTAWGDNTYGQTTTSVTATATGAVNATTITVSPANPAISTGMLVTGVGIGNGAIVQSVVTTTVTLSVPNTVAVSAANPLTFSIAGVTSIAAGGLHTLALKNDGTVMAWGAGKTTVANNPNSGQSIIPAGLTTLTVNATVPANPGGTTATVTLAAANAGIVAGMSVTGPAFTVGAGAKVVSVASTTVTLSVSNANSVLTATQLTFSSSVWQIAAGYYFSLALKSDGSVVGWGDNSSGQTTIPAGLTTVTAVATVPPNPAGTVSTVTLTAANAAIVPGMFVTGPAGTVGPGAKIVSKSAAVPPVLTLSVPNAVNTNAANTTATLTFSSGVVAIAAGNEHSVALKSDGTVTAWGRNVEGQTTIPAGLSGVTAIAAGGDTSYALKSDGTVVAWGDDTNGQVTGATALSAVAAIAAGGDHALALKSDATVVAWGKIWNGSAFVSETVPPSLSAVSGIAAGAYHSLAITVGTPPIITVQPVSVTTVQGGTVTLSVSAPNAVSFQWLKNGAIIPGATGSTLTLTNVQAVDADTYTVLVTNSFGSVISSPATVSGIFTPDITSQPRDVTVNQPAPSEPAVTVIFDVSATGGSLIYQWQKNGVVIADGVSAAGTTISGATTNVLTLSTITTTDDVGSYTVVITNSVGGVVSQAATLRVVPNTMVPVVPPDTTVKPAITSNLDPLPLIKGVPMAPYLITTNIIPTRGYSARGLPRGLKLNSRTGVISGTPTRAGTYAVTLQAKGKSTGTASARKVFSIP